MIRLYLLIVLIALGYFLVRKVLTGQNPLRKLYNKNTWLILAGLVLVMLAITGHLALLTAAIGVLVTFVVRNLPLVLRYAPQLHRFWQTFKTSKQQKSSTDYGAPVRDKMTVTDAYNILGLKPPVAKQDIILAHKKLMQKMHPDRGGSDYLASQINLAKDLLLKN